MNYFNKLLICFVGFSLIPSTLLLMAMISSHHYAQNRVFAHSDQLIASGCRKLEIEILEYLDIINTLAINDDISGYLLHPTELRKVKANRKLYYHTGGKTGYLAAYVISADQKHHIGTDIVPAIYANPIRSSWGLLRMIRQTDVIVMRPSEHSVYEGRETVFSLGCPVARDGRVLGYLVVDVKRPLLESLYPNMSDATTYLYQGNNLIYNSSDPKTEGLGRLPELVAKHEITGIHKREGKNVSLARAQVLGGVLSVAQAADLGTVDRTFSYATIGYLITILVLLIFCPIIAYYVARNVTRPIIEVTNALREVKGGNLDMRINLNRSDEIGRMGDGFNEMTAQIQELISNVREKQHELNVARNRALLAQVNPHFLYNTLDLIKWASKMNDNATAEKATINLGRLLRSIVNIDADVIPVRRELEIIRHYVSIQKLRYGARLEYREDIPDTLLDQPIPRLLFQPLVENAIEHGTQKKDGIGILVIRGRREGARLVFEVLDNGTGFPDNYVIQPPDPKTEMLKGIGLFNVHRRAQLYGDEECGLKFGRDQDGNTVVSVTVPDGILPAAALPGAGT